MKIIKFLLAFILVLVLGLIIGSFFLPSTAQVERSITIEKPVDNVFSIVNDLSRFNEWSPWHGLDPQANYQFEGPQSGVGAKMMWQSQDKNVGSGSQEIIESAANEKVVIALDFGQQGKAIAEILTQPVDDNTLVTWKLISDAQGSMIGKYFNLMLDSMVGPMYETGLTQLKAIAESS